MNKTAIKNFAVWARNKLIADISYRAGLMGITESGIASALPQSTGTTEFYDIGTAEPYAINGDAVRQRRRLVELIERKEKETDYKTAYKYIIEEVAYTWFNRLIAIRFMEVNDYLPSHIRVLSSESGKMEPDLVTTPFESDFQFTREEEMLIVQLKQDNQVDEIFRFLFIKQCNALYELLPSLFEETNDYSELLLNLSIVDKDGVIYHLVHDIPEEDFDVEKGGQVEIIGWLYQSYNIEPKDETFALLKKNIKITKDRVPAATQLFTPDWIVRYMVENSLGRVWLERHHNPELQADWKYYLDDAEQESDVINKLQMHVKEYKIIEPKDIKVIDLCMGSGHILVYCFDVLIQIYESQGYSMRDATQLILKHNLFGLDIDKRAAQLSYFAVMMKARQYDRRILNKGIVPNVFCIDESNGINRNHLQYFGKNLSTTECSKAYKEIIELINNFTDAKEYGSILQVEHYDWELLNKFIQDLAVDGQLNFETLGIEKTQKELKKLLVQGQIMEQKYDVVVTNPPYMGNKGMSPKLSKYVQTNFPDEKNDMFAVFTRKCGEITKINGYYSLITQPSILFLSSFEKLRNRLIREKRIVNLLHMGRGIFGIDFGSTAFVICNNYIPNYNGQYLKLHQRTFQYIEIEEIEKLYLKAKEDHEFEYDFSMYSATKEDLYVDPSVDEIIQEVGKQKIYYKSKQDAFLALPNSPIAYTSSIVADIYKENPLFKDVAYSFQGIITGDNNYFLRMWHEVDYKKIILNAKDIQAVQNINGWVPYNKGGDFRKWYGNNTYIMRWTQNGTTLTRARTENKNYYFKPGITWSFVCSRKFSSRYFPNGYLWDVAGSSIFENGKAKLYEIIAIMNSVVGEYLLSISNPTINFQVENILSLPYVKMETTALKECVEECIELCKEDWDSHEQSWDFKRNPLCASGLTKIEEALHQWSSTCEKKHARLKFCEEMINEQLIEAYGLASELSAEVLSENITIQKVEKQKAIKELLSYAVGCMFGRYSLNYEGISYAGGEWDKNRYIDFEPDDDGIIPITDEGYLEDDIITKLSEWLKIAFGSETLENNLDYIASALGKKGNTSREIIRSYFLEDFFKDHCNAYSITGSGKRPIYWLFDSGKKNGFKALIYMHRYNTDTIGNVRIDYLHRMQRVYESEICRMQDMIDHSSSAREVAVATKRKEKLQKQLKECREYDEKIGHLALSRIDIDLDDGVKVNYEKVQTASDGKKYQVLAKI